MSNHASADDYIGYLEQIGSPGKRLKAAGLATVTAAPGSKLGQKPSAGAAGGFGNLDSSPIEENECRSRAIRK
jgi:hypothetical protein